MSSLLFFSYICSHAGGVLVLLLNLLLTIYACEFVILPSEVLKIIA